MVAEERRWQVASARTMLLTIFGVAWLAVVVITAVNNKGQVPNELWPVLGFGVGTIMAAFRIDDFARRDRDEQGRKQVPGSPPASSPPAPAVPPAPPPTVPPAKESTP